MKGIVLLFASALGLALTCAGQKPLTAADVVGDWTGESKCQGNKDNSSCHDETVMYHFTAVNDQPLRLHVAADKLVNGNWEPMGEMEFAIERDRPVLTAAFPVPRTGGKGVLVLTYMGDKMDGVMTLYPENQVVRKIHIARKR